MPGCSLQWLFLQMRKVRQPAAAVFGKMPAQLLALRFSSKQLSLHESGTSQTLRTAESCPPCAHSKAMLAGIKGMSWGRQSVTILCHKTCPLACLLSAQPSLQKRKNSFLFAFSFSAVRAAQGLAVGVRGSPAVPLCPRSRGLSPSLLVPGLHAVGMPVGECPGISPSWEPPISPVLHPQALCPAGLQGGDPAVACSQPDNPTVPYPHSAVACCFFQETFKR